MTARILHPFLAFLGCIALFCACDDGATPPVTTPGAGGNGGDRRVFDPETCDGMDNDGDGFVDEGGLRRACNTACGAGIELCANGAWSGCNAEQTKPESCDGQDEDCDGQIDEDLSRPCESACGSGNETCSLGSWIACSAPAAEVETCNGIDDDCDTEIDERLFRPCSSDCSAGTESCVNGSWSDCDAQERATELCSDDVDNDCDGQVDEGCACRAGTVERCSTNLGLCNDGERECTEDSVWTRCEDEDGEAVREPGDLPETCNGEDDDCNGVADDIPAQPCGSSDVGACSLGQLTCARGELRCEGEIRAISESCDSIDNDCDGRIDENLPDDEWEVNEECRRAEDLMALPEQTEDPRRLTANLYRNDGSPDVDYYTVLFEEAWNPCVFNDSGYLLTVELSNIPEGTQYRLCLTITRPADTLNEACEDDEGILHEACGDYAEDEDGIAQAQSLSYQVMGRCGRNDDVRVFARVEALEESPTSCRPYSLSFSSVSMDNDE